MAVGWSAVCDTHFLKYYIYILSKNRNVTYIVPKIVSRKRYLRTIVFVFIALQTSGSDFLVLHSWQKDKTVTENVSNSEKTCNVHKQWHYFSFFLIYEYSLIKNGMNSMPFNSQFKEIKGKTFYPLEIISLAINLYLLIICRYLSVFFFNSKLRISFVRLQTIFLC